MIMITAHTINSLVAATLEVGPNLLAWGLNLLVLLTLLVNQIFSRKDHKATLAELRPNSGSSALDKLNKRFDGVEEVQALILGELSDQSKRIKALESSVKAFESTTVKEK